MANPCGNLAQSDVIDDTPALPEWQILVDLAGILPKAVSLKGLQSQRLRGRECTSKEEEHNAA